MLAARCKTTGTSGCAPSGGREQSAKEQPLKRRVLPERVKNKDGRCECSAENMARAPSCLNAFKTRCKFASPHIFASLKFEVETYQALFGAQYYSTAFFGQSLVK
jgi:hypothetical protein